MLFRVRGRTKTERGVLTRAVEGVTGAEASSVESAWRLVAEVPQFIVTA